MPPIERRPRPHSTMPRHSLFDVDEFIQNLLCPLESVRILIKDEDNVFEATASIGGSMEHQAGFFIKRDDDWITAELTCLRGVSKKVNKQDESVKEEAAILSVLFYNDTGQRGYTSIKNRVLEFNKKTVFLEGKTELIGTMSTLMSLDASKRFLRGDTIEIKHIYQPLKDRQRRFVNFEWDERLYDLETCITIATYFFEVFGVFPIIFFFGSPKTGKGRALKCVVYAAHKGFLIVSPTEATTFRIIDAMRPTLGIDEFTRLEEDIMRIIRAGYKRGLKVPRVEKPKKHQFSLSFFETFAPLILASTKYLEPVTMTRTITVNMKRASESWLVLESSKREPKSEDFEDLRDELYICRLTQANKVHEVMEELNRQDLGIYDREMEIWCPILSIAKLVSDEVFNSLLSLAKEIYNQKHLEIYEEEKDILLAISILFHERGNPSKLSFFPKNISEKLWQTKRELYIHGETGSEKIDSSLHIDARRDFEKDYSPRRIGWKLRPLGLKKERAYGGSRYLITKDDFVDLCARYGLDVEKEV